MNLNHIAKNLYKYKDISGTAVFRTKIADAILDEIYDQLKEYHDEAYLVNYIHNMYCYGFYPSDSESRIQDVYKLLSYIKMDDQTSLTLSTDSFNQEYENIVESILKGFIQKIYGLSERKLHRTYLNYMKVAIHTLLLDKIYSITYNNIQNLFQYGIPSQLVTYEYSIPINAITSNGLEKHLLVINRKIRTNEAIDKLQGEGYIQTLEPHQISNTMYKNRYKIYITKDEIEKVDSFKTLYLKYLQNPIPRVLTLCRFLLGIPIASANHEIITTSKPQNIFSKDPKIHIDKLKDSIDNIITHLDSILVTYRQDGHQIIKDINKDKLTRNLKYYIKKYRQNKISTMPLHFDYISLVCNMSPKTIFAPDTFPDDKLSHTTFLHYILNAKKLFVIYQKLLQKTIDSGYQLFYSFNTSDTLDIDSNDVIGHLSSQSTYYTDIPNIYNIYEKLLTRIKEEKNINTDSNNETLDTSDLSSIYDINSIYEYLLEPTVVPLILNRLYLEDKELYNQVVMMYTKDNIYQQGNVYVSTTKFKKTLPTCDENQILPSITTSKVYAMIEDVIIINNVPAICNHERHDLFDNIIPVKLAPKKVELLLNFKLK